MNHPSKAAYNAGCLCDECHPSATAYSEGCRCERCRAFRCRKAKIVAIYGSSLVDARPIAERVAQFTREGFPLQAVAQAAGVSPRSLSPRVLSGRRTVRRTTATAIMGLSRNQIIRACQPEQFVPTVGASRRLKALMFMGWRLKDLAANKSEYHLFNCIRTNDPQARVRADSHRLICDLYERLSMTQGPAMQNRAKAKTFGYVPPLGWDDIDDPSAVPNFGQLPDESDTRMDLYQQGLSDGQIGVAVGVSTDAIQKWRTRRNLPANYYTREGCAS